MPGSHPPDPAPTRTARNARCLMRADDVVAARLEVAARSLARMRGLLGRSALGPDEGLWITPCTSIHMLFMRFAIDAVFVDADLTIVRIVADLRPWRLARGGRGAHSVFELPAGRASQAKLRVGDRLSVAPPAHR